MLYWIVLFLFFDCTWQTFKELNSEVHRTQCGFISMKCGYVICLNRQDHLEDIKPPNQAIKAPSCHLLLIALQTDLSLFWGEKLCFVAKEQFASHLSMGFHPEHHCVPTPMGGGGGGTFFLLPIFVSELTCTPEALKNVPLIKPREGRRHTS